MNGPALPAGSDDLHGARENLRRLVEPLDLHPPEKKLGTVETPIRELRRVRRGPVADNIGMISLVKVDGMLRWELGPGFSGVLSGRRAGRAGRAAGGRGQVVDQFKFEKLEPSEVVRFLQQLDEGVNRQLANLYDSSNQTPGLRWWNQATETLELKSTVPSTGRILLFVHGFISSNDHNLSEIRTTAKGKQLLADAAKHYDAVLTFDHATLAVSPFLNALDLHRLLRMSQAKVDVVCHSRGGLVVRWWAEAFRAPTDQQVRVVFVGSPLAGTGLAAPPKLRATLNWLSNVGDALGGLTDIASAGAPFLQIASGLMKIMASLTGALAHAPVVDAVIAMVPGIAAMSQVGNSADLLRMRAHQYANAPEYFAIRADFEPEDVPLWAFWRRLKNDRLANCAADAVFDEANDLVVDTKSMTSLADLLDLSSTAGSILDFKTGPTVHHTNYFRQSATLDYIRQWLQVPP